MNERERERKGGGRGEEWGGGGGCHDVPGGVYHTQQLRLPAGLNGHFLPSSMKMISIAFIGASRLISTCCRGGWVGGMEVCVCVWGGGGAGRGGGRGGGKGGR